MSIQEAAHKGLLTCPHVEQIAKVNCLDNFTLACAGYAFHAVLDTFNTDTDEGCKAFNDFVESATKKIPNARKYLPYSTIAAPLTYTTYVEPYSQHDIKKVCHEFWSQFHS